MSDEQLGQALAELGDVVRCRCHEAYRDRDLQDPQCQCDSMDAVRVVLARIEALERERREAALDALAAMGQAQEAYEAQLKAEAKVEQLEREAILDAKLLADAQDLLDKAEVVMREAADRIQQLGRERDAAIAALEESGRKRGETLALLDKAVVAMRKAADGLDGYVGHGYGDYLRDTLAEIEGRVVPGLQAAAERTKGMLVERAPAPQGMRSNPAKDRGDG
jgi:hypothetical protein